MTVGTVSSTDGWTAGVSKPLTADHPPIGAGSATSSAVHGARAAADHLSHWLEAALGPAFTGLGRELDAAARRLDGPGQFRHPWIWVGAAAGLGFILGRSRALRPLAAFTVRTAMTTFIERAMRAES